MNFHVPWLSERNFCAWCGIEMKLRRVLLLRTFCKSCAWSMDALYEGPPRPFHSRIGMSER